MSGGAEHSVAHSEGIEAFNATIISSNLQPHVAPCHHAIEHKLILSSPLLLLVLRGAQLTLVLCARPAGCKGPQRKATICSSCLGGVFEPIGTPGNT